MSFGAPMISFKKIVIAGLVAFTLALIATGDQGPEESPLSSPEQTDPNGIRFHVPVEVLDSDDAIAREQEAIAIQRSLKDSSRTMNWIAAAQTALLLVGTFVLIITLRQTHQATKAASEATRASILIARKQSQSQFLVTVENSRLVWRSSDFQIETKVTVENVGKGAAVSLIGYLAIEAVKGYPTVEAGETLRWAYVPAGQREIPPWSFERSILRPTERIADEFPFYQRTFSRGDIDWENEFAENPNFYLFIFLEWTDVFDENCSSFIILKSFDDAKTWREVERTNISFEQFCSRVKYPY